ncbi:hypothetical protein H8S90_00125 [Olivibacter sp. SDN3]|uniref:hypothetical protein n=1 Tax=Olivibacter sp. SDN3 TaxID=2764720 RepID=UPI0016510C84|nr:hypothetical protein [Olivibacter sp. SDN3]QNL50090.1 hypothetical protein H8S90_00125 [Olivibacter sp. SDN3]
MKKSLLTALCIIVLSCIGSEVRAQATQGYDYKSAIGGRFGVANGITFKTFLTDQNALDVILNFRSNSKSSTFKLVGLYEIHNPINDVQGLRWYYGGGAGIGTYKNKETDNSGAAFSIDGVLGLDYKIDGAPINLSLDWKPEIRFAPDNSGVDFAGFGLSIRFAF